MKPAEVKREWHVVDASQYRLGRMATRLARILQGKHRPTYTPHVDTGDFVVVINADKVQTTGRKRDQKVYTRYTGWVDGLRKETLAEKLNRKPEEVITLAVRRMLPKTRLGRQMLTKLKVYAGSEHPHAAQAPKELKL
jgi:large subunit ribosomal protein L13